MEVSSNNLFLCISFYGKILTCLEKARWNLAVIFHINKMKHSLQLTLWILVLGSAATCTMLICCEEQSLLEVVWFLKVEI